MKNRKELLKAVDAFNSLRSDYSVDAESPAWKAAHEQYETELWKAGVYKESLLGQKALREKQQDVEPEKTFYDYALAFATFKTVETLKEYHSTPTYTARMDIQKRIDAAHELAEQQRLNEEKARKRASCERMLADEKARERAAREQAEIERNFKLAFIASVQNGASAQNGKEPKIFRGVQIVKKDSELKLNGVDCNFKGPKRWEIVLLLTTTEDKDGWAVIPEGSKALGCFKGCESAERFRSMIEPKSQGSGNQKKQYRIRA